MSQPNDQANQHLLIALKAAELLGNLPTKLGIATNDTVVSQLNYIYTTHISEAHRLSVVPDTIVSIADALKKHDNGF
jgi:hypothetical protein